MWVPETHSSQVRCHLSRSHRHRLAWSRTHRCARCACRKSGRWPGLFVYALGARRELLVAQPSRCVARRRNAMNPTPSPCVSTTTHEPEEANWPNVGNLTHLSHHEHPAQQHKTCATVGDAEALPRQRCSRSQLADQREHSTWHLATPGSDHQPRPLNHGKQPRMSRSDLRLTEAHHLRH